MDWKEKYERIYGNLAKVKIIEEITHEEVISICKKNEPSAFWGIAPIGYVHSGYAIHLNKIKDLLNANFKVKIFNADRHAYLDNRKIDWEFQENRATYHEKSLELLMDILKIDKNSVEFVRASELINKKEYVDDLYLFSAYVTYKRCKRAASQESRRRASKLSELMYPLLQNLDFKYLNVDLAIHAIDQRHVWMLGREFHHVLNFLPTAIYYNQMLDLGGNSFALLQGPIEKRIFLHDSPEIIKKKVEKAFCPVGLGNPILEHLQQIVFAAKSSIKLKNREYTFEQLQKDYLKGNITPIQIKSLLSNELISLFEKAREYFADHQELLEYPHKSEMISNSLKQQNCSSTLPAYDISR